MECWEIRGCDAEMMAGCPHANNPGYTPCPADCRFTDCLRPQHKIATDIALLLDATVNREAAIKEACRSCENFLKNGPRIMRVGTDPIHAERNE